jgi:hypothetical protein
MTVNGKPIISAAIAGIAPTKHDTPDEAHDVIGLPRRRPPA